MVIKNFRTLLMLLGCFILVAGCTDDNESCDASAIQITGEGICLVFEHQGLSTSQRTTIENKVVSGMTTINNLMSIDNVLIRIVENSSFVIPEIGLGGYNPSEGEVILAIDINFNDLNTSLEEEFIPMLAHEIHHAKRRRSVGYGNTLLQAVVSEGLADHFSMEVAGIDPPIWSVAVTGTDLQNWIDVADDTWHDTPYDHNGWFFGTDTNIPRWTGYSIGYELVKNYLASHPDQLPSMLHNESADSFEP